MKILAKSALALAIAATTSGTAFAQMGDAPDLIGVTGSVRPTIQCTSGDNEDATCGFEDKTSRFTITAEDDLGNGNTAFGKFEFGVNPTNGGETTTRLSYVGVSGGFGSFSLGTRWRPYYNTTVSPTDFARGFGGTWHSAAGFLGGFRASNSVFYSVGGFSAMITAENNNVAAVDAVAAVNGTQGNATLENPAGTVLQPEVEDDDGNITTPGTYYLDSTAGTDAVDAVAAVEDDDDIDIIEVAYNIPIGGWTLGIAAIDTAYDDPTTTNVDESDTTIGAAISGHVGSVRLALGLHTQDDITRGLGQVQAPVGGGTLTFSIGEDFDNGEHESGDNADRDAITNSSIALEYSRPLGAHSLWFVGVENNSNDVATGFVDGDGELVDDTDVTHYGFGMRYSF